MHKSMILVMAVIMSAIFLPLTAEEWQTATDTVVGFSFDYPASWEKQVVEGTVITITHLEEDMPIIITAMSEPLPKEQQDSDFSAPVDSMIAGLRADLEEQGLSSIKITDQGEIDFHGIPAYELNLQVSFMDVILMRMENIIIKNGSDVIFLTVAAEDATFENYRDTFEQIKTSFKLIERRAE